jgi:hypothetical protein
MSIASKTKVPVDFVTLCARLKDLNELLMTILMVKFYGGRKKACII